MSAAKSRASVSTRGPVLIIGTGLLGTSLALALRTADVEVQLSDTSPTSLALARDMGAGTPHDKHSPEPQVVVVATPPDVTADVVVAQLSAHPNAVVTDVASVKERVVAEVRARAGAEARRYVGSHPMAGRERSGAGSADSDLFAGRPWVVVGQDSDPEAELAIRNLAVDVGATPVRMGASEHDAAVAAVSHTPQLIASRMSFRSAVSIKNFIRVSSSSSGVAARSMSRTHGRRASRENGTHPGKVRAAPLYYAPGFALKAKRPLPSRTSIMMLAELAPAASADRRRPPGGRITRP